MAMLEKQKKFRGKMLYHRRISLGMTLRAVSDKVGRSVTAVSKWESNKYGPNPKSIFILARILKVKPEYFYQKYAEA